MPGRFPLLLPLCGLGIEAAFLYLASIGDLRAQVPRFWGAIFPAFLLYLLASVRVLGKTGGSLVLILLFGLLFRLTFWWSPPSLSDDIFRYLWDGRVQLAGINPYLYPPAAEEVAPLRDALYPAINNREVPTIYPPLAQLFFRLVCFLHPSPGGIKLGLLLCELGLLLLLVRILRQRRQDPARLLLYAWNPLPVVEIAGSGHVDIMGVLLLVLALYLLAGGRPGTAALSLAGAFLSKLLPVLLLPFFWQRLAPAGAGSRWRRLFALRSRLPLLGFPVLAAGGFLPFLDAGSGLFSGLRTYLLHWRSNDAAFSLFHAFFGYLFPDGTALIFAKVACAAVLLLIVLWAALRIGDPYRAAFWALGAYALLSPTLHPWYLLWIMPFLPLFATPAWILLSGLVFLAYEVLIEYSTTGVWKEQMWVRGAQYGPFYLLFLLYPVYQRRRMFGKSPKLPCATGEPNR